MAFQSLYRKHRPQTFGELVGQESVSTALRNAVREGRVGHAYLFSGPRGTGKTTTARLLAKALNCTGPRDELPPGHDLVFLSNVIHGENEDTNRALMRKIHAALTPGGRVMIKDHVTDESGTSPAPAAIFSIAMLLFTRGRDYAYAEIRDWLTAAGFGRVEADVLPPGLISTLVVAWK